MIRIFAKRKKRKCLRTGTVRSLSNSFMGIVKLIGLLHPIYSSYQRFQSLTVKNTQKLERRATGMLISDLPLLNGREAGIEH